VVEPVETTLHDMSNDLCLRHTYKPCPLTSLYQRALRNCPQSCQREDSRDGGFDRLNHHATSGHGALAVVELVETSAVGKSSMVVSMLRQAQQPQAQQPDHQYLKIDFRVSSKPSTDKVIGKGVICNLLVARSADRF